MKKKFLTITFALSCLVIGTVSADTDAQEKAWENAEETNRMVEIDPTKKDEEIGGLTVDKAYVSKGEIAQTGMADLFLGGAGETLMMGEKGYGEGDTSLSIKATLTPFLVDRKLPYNATYHPHVSMKTLEALIPEKDRKEIEQELQAFRRRLDPFFGVIAVPHGRVLNTAYVIHSSYKGDIPPLVKEMFDEQGMSHENILFLRGINERLLSMDTIVNDVLLETTAALRREKNIDVPYHFLSIDSQQVMQLHEDKKRKLYTAGWAGSFVVDGFVLPMNIRLYLAKQGETYYGMVVYTTAAEKAQIEKVTDKLMLELAEKR